MKNNPIFRVNSSSKISTILLSLIFLVFLTSCATLHQNYKKNDLLVYTVDYDETIIRRYRPIFLIENPKEKHNLIGTPSAGNRDESKGEIFIDHEIPSIYVEIRKFNTSKDSYTNLIYRIHFEKIPFSLFPFYLGSGKNVGLIVVVTLNSEGVPILYTTVHTCGCYLAFIPTSYMSQDTFPDDWNRERQTIYGEILPGILDFKDGLLDQAITLIALRNNSHRVKDILISNEDFLMGYKTAIADIKPLNSLQNLPLGDVGSTSFYQDAGYSKGYVKDSSKPWEVLLMSWWVFDWRVGQDKKLGKDHEDGPIFYTSLKPWTRNESDMRVFTTFLKYWGWKL